MWYVMNNETGRYMGPFDKGKALEIWNRIPEKLRHQWTVDGTSDEAAVTVDAPAKTPQPVAEPKKEVLNVTAWPDAVGILKSTHILIAGTTGSGKSTLLNNLLFNALVWPFHEPAPIGQGMFAFIDLKRVELRDYKPLPTCIGYATEEKDAVDLLKRINSYIEREFSTMTGKETDAPPLYVVVDELADLSTNKAALEQLVRIGRLGRAAHVHLICATQDPSRQTLSAQLMHNFTTRIALRCEDAIESRQIIGVAGAEQLPRHGKCLIRDAEGVGELEVPISDLSPLPMIIKKYQMMFA